MIYISKMFKNHIACFNTTKNQCINAEGWLGYIGDYTTQLHRDYFISQYKDPY